MKTIPFLSIAALTLPSWLACTGTSPRPTTPVPIAQGPAVCEYSRAFCEKSCASCKDRAACFENGGECAGAGVSFNDIGDVGPDIWKPGCHYKYDDDFCTPPGRFLLGDECSSTNAKELHEWTNSDCHPPSGDTATYDCDKACLAAGRGHGRCTPDPTACDGQGSAACTCDQPTP